MKQTAFLLLLLLLPICLTGCGDDDTNDWNTDCIELVVTSDYTMGDSFLSIYWENAPKSIEDKYGKPVRANFPEYYPLDHIKKGDIIQVHVKEVRELFMVWPADIIPQD